MQKDIKSMNIDEHDSLHSAVQRGLFNLVKCLIEEKEHDINERDSRGRTPLHWAVENGHLEIVKYLIDNGADLNVEDKDYRFPLYLAAYNGHLGIVKYLIEDKKANFIYEDDDYSPLHLAAKYDHLEIVKYLIDEQKADFTVGDKEGKKPLHLAAENGHLDTVKYLLSKGASFFEIDNEDRFPLHLAAENGHLDIVKYLLDDADFTVDCDDNDLNNGLDRAIIQFFTDDKVTLIGYTLGCISLCYAAKNGHLNVVKYLIDEKNADFTVKAVLNGRGVFTGRAPLSWAAENGHLDVVKYLIDEKKADFIVKNNDGRTPLQLADYNDHLDVTEYLIEKGADINIKNSKGKTALDIETENDEIKHLLTDAAKQGNLDKVKELIANGADFNIKDNDRRTLLHWAAYKGHLGIVKYLIDEKKVNRTVKTSYGWTPLHFASKHGHLDTVKYLIDEKKADFNVKEFGFSYTPLHLAAQNGKLDVIKYLVEKGADVNAESGLSATPLFRAADFNVALYLIEKGAERENVIWFDMLDPVVSFTGRSSELKTLHDKLQIAKAIAIVGLGGVGKSELARKYVCQYYKYYDRNIIWINAKSKESLKKSFCRLAEVLKVSTIEKIGKKEQERNIRSIINDIYKYFNLIKGLLIFDNAEEYEDIREFLPSSGKKLHILITSRNKKWEETISLGAFTEKEAIEYIKKTLDIKSNLQSNYIKELVEKLQCYPLALSQAISYIKKRKEIAGLFGKKFEFSDCLEEYEKIPEKLLSCELECTDNGYTKTTLTIWKSAIEKIKQKEYGQEALSILESCVDSNKIPVEELVPKLKVNEKKLCNAIELLEQYSMIEIKAGILSIDKLVWQVIRLRIQKEEKEKECPKT